MRKLFTLVIMSLMSVLYAGKYPIPYDADSHYPIAKAVVSEEIVPFQLQEIDDPEALVWLQTTYTLKDIEALIPDVKKCTDLYEKTMNLCVQKFVEKNGLTATLGKKTYVDKTLFWAPPYDQIRLGIDKDHKRKITYADNSVEHKDIFLKGYEDFYVAGSNVQVRNGNYNITQGALPRGQNKSETIQDFWDAVILSNSSVIVCVNDPEEKIPIRGYQETTAYWTEDLFPMKLKNGWIIESQKNETELASSQDYPGVKIIKRTFVASSEGETRLLTQFHYTGWPDGLGPPDFALLEKLHKAVDAVSNEKSPITAHCGNGLGRSALFAISHLFHREITQKAQAGSDPTTLKLDIINTIYEWNKQRPLQLSEGVQWQSLMVAVRRSLLQQMNTPEETIRSCEKTVEAATQRLAQEKLAKGIKKLQDSSQKTL